MNFVRSQLCLVLSHRSPFQLSSVVTFLSILSFDSLLCMSDSPDPVSPDLRAQFSSPEKGLECPSDQSRQQVFFLASFSSISWSFLGPLRKCCRWPYMLVYRKLGLQVCVLVRVISLSPVFPSLPPSLPCGYRCTQPRVCPVPVVQVRGQTGFQKWAFTFHFVFILCFFLIWFFQTVSLFSPGWSPCLGRIFLVFLLFWYPVSFQTSLFPPPILLQECWAYRQQAVTIRVFFYF